MTCPGNTPKFQHLSYCIDSSDGVVLQQMKTVTETVRQHGAPSKIFQIWQQRELIIYLEFTRMTSQ